MFLRVVAQPLLPIEDLHPDDISVPGTYEVQLDENLSEEDSASAALDGFHSTVPVKNLDDFDFTVMTADGRVVEESPDSEGYSLTDAAVMVVQIDEE